MGDVNSGASRTRAALFFVEFVVVFYMAGLPFGPHEFEVTIEFCFVEAYGVGGGGTVCLGLSRVLLRVQRTSAQTVGYGVALDGAWFGERALYHRRAGR